MDGKREAPAEESGERSSLRTLLGFPVHGGGGLIIRDGWGFGHCISLAGVQDVSSI